MQLMIYVGDEGPTDYDFKDGDLWGVQPDSWIPSTNEKKFWLIVKMADYGGQQTELVEPEYGNGLQPNGMAVQRHARKYCVSYWEKLTPEELAAARDKTVAVEPMVGRFDIWDITRK